MQLGSAVGDLVFWGHGVGFGHVTQAPGARGILGWSAPSVYRARAAALGVEVEPMHARV